MTTPDMDVWNRARTSTGGELDSLGRLYNVLRSSGETEDAFRVRVLAALPSLGADVVVPSDERAAFEAWFCENGCYEQEWLDWHRTGMYSNADTQNMFEAWQARAALTTPMSPQEPVAWLTPELDRVVTAITMSGARKDGGAMLSSLQGYTVPAYPAAPMSGGVGAKQAVQHVVEALAKQWDACDFEDVGGAIDIGDAIRSEGLRMSHQLQVAPTGAADDKGATCGWEKCPHGADCVHAVTPAHPVPASPAVEVASEDSYTVPARTEHRPESCDKGVSWNCCSMGCEFNKERAAALASPAPAAVTEVAGEEPMTEAERQADLESMWAFQDRQRARARAAKSAAPHPAVAVPAGLTNWHQHHVAVEKAALQMVRNALRTDAEAGRSVRAEMLELLDNATSDLAATSTTAPKEGEAS